MNHFSVNLQQLQANGINLLLSHCCGQCQSFKPIKYVVCQCMDLKAVCIHPFWAAAYRSKVKAILAFLDEVFHVASFTVKTDYIFRGGIHICNDERIHVNQLIHRFFNFAYNTSRVISETSLIHELAMADSIWDHIILCDFRKRFINISSQLMERAVHF